MSVRGRYKLGIAAALVAAVATVPLIFGSVGNAGFSVPVNKVLQDPFADGLGYHGSAEEPSIFAWRNPSPAVHPGSNPNKSTIVATEQVGRVYDGGASDIGYEVSVNGGDTWKNGELPITIQGGQANTCAGPANRASDTVTAYNEKYDTWLISTLPLANGSNVPGVFITIGKVRFTSSDPTTFMGGPPAGVGDIAWSPPICQHITQSGESPDKNWITCDNWSTSKGYGNCYVEWDNNGNGNREIMQTSTDGGLTWYATPSTNMNASSLPGNGNTGDVTNETTLACSLSTPACAGGGANAAFTGDTNVKVASVANINTTLSAASIAGDANIKVGSIAVFKATTLAAAANAGDTNIKVTSTQNLVPGGTLNLNADNTPGSAIETAVISTVGTSGATGTGVTVTAPLASAHPSGALVTVAGQSVNVDTGANLETATVRSVGTTGAAGTGVQLTTGLTLAHASGAQVNTAIKVEVDFSGGNQEIVMPTNVGSATFSTTLSAAAATGATNIKVGSVTGLTVGRTLTLEPNTANAETVTITVVGTTGATGTGVTFTPALAHDHASGALVQDSGTGITFAPALVRNHWVGIHVANAAANQAGHTGDIGGVPLVQPPPPGASAGSTCGRVVVPLASNGVSWWTSNDCGKNWSAETQITPNMTAGHSVPNIRTSLLPTSAMDGAGNIYVVWQTRSFRTGSVSSTPNDIAMSVMPAPTAANPNPSFGPPVRIPIEADNTTANTDDHFIPGISADPNTSGSGAHLGLYFYNFHYNNTVGTCNYVDPANPAGACNMRVGFVSSTNGGATWSAPTYMANMSMPSLVRSSQGLMVGDYSSADVIPNGPHKGNSISAFAVGLDDKTQNQPMYVRSQGMPITSGPAPAQKASPAAVEQARTFVSPPVQVPPRVP